MSEETQSARAARARSPINGDQEVWIKNVIHTAMSQALALRHATDRDAHRGMEDLARAGIAEGALREICNILRLEREDDPTLLTDRSRRGFAG